MVKYINIGERRSSQHLNINQQQTLPVKGQDV